MVFILFCVMLAPYEVMVNISLVVFTVEVSKLMSVMVLNLFDIFYGVMWLIMVTEAMLTNDIMVSLVWVMIVKLAMMVSVVVLFIVKSMMIVVMFIKVYMMAIVMMLSSC